MATGLALTLLALTLLGFITGSLPLWVPMVLFVLTLAVMAHDLWEVYRRWAGARLFNNREQLDSFPFSGVVWGGTTGASSWNSRAWVRAAIAPASGPTRL